MNTSTVLARALSAVNKKTVYKSPGKMPPFEANTWPEESKCDCSGFVDWCFRFSPNRKVDHPLYKKVNGGWFETTGIFEDGMSSTGYFTRLDDALPGALLVYPDYVDADQVNHDGHIGIVLEVAGKGIKGVKKIAHCSLGNFKQTGDAIQITAPHAWIARPEAIIVWLDGLQTGY